jgi:hypothetical protein
MLPKNSSDTAAHCTEGRPPFREDGNKSTSFDNAVVPSAFRRRRRKSRPAPFAARLESRRRSNDAAMTADCQSTAEYHRAPALPGWLALLAPGTSLLALGILGLADAIVLIVHIGVRGEQTDQVVFIVSALLLAPICSGIQTFLVKPNFGSLTSNSVEAVNVWAATGLLIALATIPLLIYGGIGAGGDIWLPSADRVVITIALLQAVALVVVSRVSKNRVGVAERVLKSRVVQVATFLPVAFVSSAVLFRIDPSNRHLNLFISLFVDPPFASEPGPFPPGPAFILAAFAVAALVAVGYLDAALARRETASRRYSIAAYCLVCVAAAVLLFDFSLAHDVFHYLTNVAAAMHILHGGALMVDAFSQYGPGPVLVTLLGFKLGPPTFGMAQLTIQLCNFLYYWLWLICLLRMTPWKLAASFFGLLAIVFFLAAWGRGYGNVNEAPSVLALRHFPTLLIVLSISNLTPPKRSSFFTALATFISSQWSVETLIGTLGIHLAFLGLLGLRDRAFARLVYDAAMAVAPAAAGIVTTTIVTLLMTGSLPDYATYLAFLTSYSPLAESWTIAASPMFLGWLPMFFAIFLVFGDAWMRIFRRSLRVANVDDETLFYRFAPMASLLMIQVSYFVSRSVDYTLIIALLSFCAIAIPAMLSVTAAVLAAGWPIKGLVLIPVTTALWALTFAFVALIRQNAPYSLLLHECRDAGRCSPASLIRGLDETIHIRPVLEHVRRPVTDGAFDSSGVIRESLSLISRWAPGEPFVTVLLGTLGVKLTATEVALMYSGKWNRWPRSFTLSDELVRPLAQRIIAAPARMREGEVVIVRSDETALGFLESAILARIRSEVTLCRLPGSSSEVVAYRATEKPDCPSN